MKNFFDLSGRSDIFRFVKKKYDFCTKIDNSKYLQNTKKILHTMKKFKISAFERYKISHSDSTNDKDMVKTKKSQRGGEFFLSLTVYTVYIHTSISTKQTTVQPNILVEFLFKNY